MCKNTRAGGKYHQGFDNMLITYKFSENILTLYIQNLIRPFLCYHLKTIFIY